MKTRSEQIAERRAQMPRSYRGIYDKATQGRSLRAAINSFCLECVCWQTKEIRLCTDLACPLWMVRPYQNVPQNAHEGRDMAVGTKKEVQKGSG
jgi:hypothetical protein